MFDWLREHLMPMTAADAQRRVDTIDLSLAQLRAKIAALPIDERASHAQDMRTLITQHANARNVLSDMLDARARR